MKRAYPFDGNETYLVSKRYPTKMWDVTILTERGTWAPICAGVDSPLQGLSGKALLAVLVSAFGPAYTVTVTKLRHGWQVKTFRALRSRVQ
jgi:hypothetical protein